MKSLENESSVTTSYKESVSIMDYESLQTSNIDIGMIQNVSRVRSSLRMALDILSISIKLYLARLSFVAKSCLTNVIPVLVYTILMNSSGSLLRLMLQFLWLWIRMQESLLGVPIDLHGSLVGLGQGPNLKSHLVVPGTAGTLWLRSRRCCHFCSEAPEVS